ncbi:MAG TPA: hypothetical protein VMV03_10025 [Spirochaetia bacterium]|nr:hypothetical protein [Spirochaetia bacterium]
MKKILPSLVVIAGVLVLMSCPSPGSASGASGGTLTINLPVISMQQVGKNPVLTGTSSYDILGTGPGSAGFQRNGITAQTVTIGSLAAGSWQVEVNGNNAAKKVISTATTQVTVVEGSTASADVLESQFTSSSGLSISLTWANALNETFVEADLTPLNGSPSTINLPAAANAGGTTTISATKAVAPGYYTLSRVFQDPTGFRSGGADSLYVPPADTASFALNVDATGAVTVTITPDPPSTFQIALSSVKANYGKGQDITVAATVSGKPSIQWYLNGALQSQTGPAVTLSNLPGGAYRLDCVAAVGGVLISDHVNFSVAGK